MPATKTPTGAPRSRFFRLRDGVARERLRGNAWQVPWWKCWGVLIKGGALVFAAMHLAVQMHFVDLPFKYDVLLLVGCVLLLIIASTWYGQPQPFCGDCFDVADLRRPDGYDWFRERASERWGRRPPAIVYPQKVRPTFWRGWIRADRAASAAYSKRQQSDRLQRGKREERATPAHRRGTPVRIGWGGW